MITDGIIRLRAPEPADVDSIYLWENDPDGRGGCTPVSRRQVWDYVQAYDADALRAGELRLLIVPEGETDAVGCIDLYETDARNRRAGVAVYIDPAHRRRGYARAALTLMLHHAKRDLGLHQLWAHVAADNAPSLALFAACGFKAAGCLRSWLRRGNRWTDVRVLQHLEAAEHP